MAGPCEMERFLLLKGNCDDSGGHRQWERQRGDTLTEENKLRRDGKTGRQSVLNISIQARAEGLSNYVNSERW